MHHLIRVYLISASLSLTVFTIGCSQAKPELSSAEMKLFEASTRGKSLTAACEEVKSLCENGGEGCQCYEHFCQDKTSEDSICDKLKTACLADCAEDAVCESACTIKDSKCGQRRRQGRDDDNADNHDDARGDHRGDRDDDDCPNKGTDPKPTTPSMPSTTSPTPPTPPTTTPPATR